MKASLLLCAWIWKVGSPSPHTHRSNSAILIIKLYYFIRSKQAYQEPGLEETGAAPRLDVNLEM